MSGVPLAVVGIRWVLQRKAAWRDIPSTYANYTSCWRWYTRWENDGTWQQIEHEITSK